MPLYCEPTFEPERTMPPGKGVIAPATPRIASTPASVARIVVSQSSPMIEKIAAADAFLGEADLALDEEFAVHDRHAPVAAPVERLGYLPFVAELAHGVADLDLEFAVERANTPPCRGRSARIGRAG